MNGTYWTKCLTRTARGLCLEVVKYPEAQCSRGHAVTHRPTAEQRREMFRCFDGGDRVVFALVTFNDSSQCALTARDYFGLTTEQREAIRELQFIGGENQ